MVTSMDKYVHTVGATHWYPLQFINGHRAEEMCKYIYQRKKMGVQWETEMKQNEVQKPEKTMTTSTCYCISVPLPPQYREIQIHIYTRTCIYITYV